MFTTKSNDHARFSVVIPLYNHARYIQAAIASVISQGEIVREIIIVDDGSTDNSAGVVKIIAKAEDRIVFWSQPNQGAHAALNSAISRATGEFVAILNSDDQFIEGRLVVLAKVFDRKKNIEFISTGIRFINGNGNPVANDWYVQALNFYQATDDLSASLVNGNFVMTTSNFAMRRKLVERVGLFAPLRYAHDLDFLLRISMRGEGFHCLKKTLLVYRLHDSNTIKENHKFVRFEWAMVVAHFLHRILARQDVSGRNIAWIDGFLDVLERHSLGRAVQLAIFELAKRPSDTLEKSEILRDVDFKKVMLGHL